MERRVALLRAVNVSGRKLAMAELRALAGEIGWDAAATYIQSGNLLFDAAGSSAELETRLEQAIAERFGINVPAMVRTAAEWARIAAGNPYPDAAEAEPNRLMLVLPKSKPAADAAEKIAAKAAAGERVAAARDVLWIHYPAGAGTTKLTPTLIDRAIGAPATQRNHSTVMKLKEMLEA